MRRWCLLLILLLNSSCSDYAKQETTTPVGKVTSDESLTRFGLRLVKKNVDDFSSTSQKFQKVLNQYCSSLEKSPIIDQRAVSSALQELTFEYYKLQGFAVANIKLQEESPGKESLQDINYSTLNRCLVDAQVIVTKNKGLAPEPLHPSVKGLFAIEYLLFDNQLVSNCNPKAQPLTVEWNALPTPQKRKDRCQHAMVLAEKISSQAFSLSQSWVPESADYQNNLLLLEYTKSDKAAVKNIVTAMGALEVIKNYTLGKPLGLNSLCIDDSGKCVNDVPHPYSNLGLTAVIAGVESYKDIFNGFSETDYSIKNYLSDKKQQALVDKMNSALDQALLTANRLNQEQPLSSWVQKMDPALCKQTTLQDPKEPICLLYKEVEQITDLYKTELLTFMSLESQSSIPQGDND